MSNVYTHSQRRPLRMGVIPIQSEKAAVQSASLGLKCITSNTDNDMQAKDRYHRWNGIGVLPAFFSQIFVVAGIGVANQYCVQEAWEAGARGMYFMWKHAGEISFRCG